MSDYEFSEGRRSHLFTEALNTLKECGKEIKDSFEGEEMVQREEKLKNLFVECKNMHENWIATSQAFEKVRTHISQKSDISDKDMVNIYNKYKNSFVEERRSKNSSDGPSVPLRESDDEEEGIIESQNFNSGIDPVTKKVMTDPYKNIHCKHSYELSVIKELIEKNPRFRCPYQGCSNKKHISLEDLVPDVELKKHIKNSSSKK